MAKFYSNRKLKIKKLVITVQELKINNAANK